MNAFIALSEYDWFSVCKVSDLMLGVLVTGACMVTVCSFHLATEIGQLCMGGPFWIPHLTEILTNSVMTSIRTAVLSNKVIQLTSKFNYHYRSIR